MIPASDPGREKVQLSGGVQEIRGLTIGEHETLQALKGAAQNVLAISFATGEPHQDVKAWYETASAADVGALTDAIARLSGLDRDARFQSRKNDDAVAVQEAT